jgi:hypothetical protein
LAGSKNNGPLQINDPMVKATSYNPQGKVQISHLLLIQLVLFNLKKKNKLSKHDFNEGIKSFVINLLYDNVRQLYNKLMQPA